MTKASPKRTGKTHPEPPVVLAQPERPRSTIAAMTAIRHDGWTILQHRLHQTETTSRAISSDAQTRQGA